MNEELKVELVEMGKLAAKSIGLFVIGLLLGGDIAQAFLIACVPYGWKVLNMITPAIFVWMPWIGWVIYIIVKIAAAALVGIFALAYTWIKCIIKVVAAYKKSKMNKSEER